MSAQVTEAHLALALQIQLECAGDYELDEPTTAQLIADSEAAALSSLAMVAAGSADRNVSLRLENDQLRAEVAALVITKDKACAAAVENKAEADGLRRALADAISTYDPNRKETLVTAERQEAWIAALQEDAK